MRLLKVGVLTALTIAFAFVPGLFASAEENVQKNKEIARQFFEEVLGKGKFELADSLHSPDFVVHTKEGLASHEENMKLARGWREAFPDLTIKVEQIVGESDHVAVYWSGRGSNTGTGNGLPATGKTIEGSGFTLYRFSKGKIAEEWSKWNSLEMMQQLGLLDCKPATGLKPTENR